MKTKETTNVDESTGIYFGAIHENSLSRARMSEWYKHDKVRDISQINLDDTLATLFEIIGSSEDEHNLDEIREIAYDRFDANYTPDFTEYYYEDNEYLAQHSQNTHCWIITKSPYYTVCKLNQSLNVGDLNSPISLNSPLGIKTYCLPTDFFKGGKIPYSYWTVNENTPVIK